MANLPSLPAVYAVTVLDQATATPDTKINPGAFTLWSNNGTPYITTSGGASINLSTGGGGGGLSSVGIADTSGTPLFNVSGTPSNPLTANGTLQFSLKSQAANLVLASPDGSSGQPVARALVATDIPALAAGKITSGTFAASLLPVFIGSGPSAAQGAVPSPGTTAGTTRYLREDGTWVAPPGGGSSGFPGASTVNAQSANYSLTSSDLNKLQTDWPTASSITFTLPTSPTIGDTYWFSAKSQSTPMKIQQGNASHVIYLAQGITTAGTTHGITYNQGARSGSGMMALSYIATNTWAWVNGYPYDWGTY